MVTLRALSPPTVVIGQGSLLHDIDLEITSRFGEKKKKALFVTSHMGVSSLIARPADWSGPLGGFVC